jgi:tetratricopeptide (TPR) repeat protein
VIDDLRLTIDECKFMSTNFWRRHSFIRHSSINTRQFSLYFALLALPSILFAASLQEQAAAAWAQRAQSGQADEAIRLWQEALRQNPSQKAIWIDLTKAMGRMVRRSSNATERAKWADQALDAGENAVRWNPHNAEAWAYYAEAIGQRANIHKGFSGLKAVKKAVAALNTAIELNPNYGYAHMLLAQFYQQAPSGISIGDKKKALEEAHKAVSDDPHHAINHLTYGKILLSNGRKQEGIAELHAVLQLQAPLDAVPETQSDQDTARELLHKMGEAEVSSSSTCSADTTQGGGYCAP